MRVEKSTRSDPDEALQDDSGGLWPPKNVIRRNRAMEKEAAALPEHYSDRLLEHIFCGRFTYFERHLALPEFQDRREKVQRGRELHRVREVTNRTYQRKRLGVVEKRIDVSLASPRLHLRGRLDELL